MRKVLILSLVISCLFSSLIYGQGNDIDSHKTYRRHFLVFYDISYPFYSKEEDRSDLKNTLKALFENKRINEFDNQYALKNEKLNGINFFDNQKDQISFFHFGLNNNDLRYLLTNRDYLKDNNLLYKSFLDKLFKEPSYKWDNFKNIHANNIATYIDSLWNIEKPSWGNGHSLSNIVYPLGIDMLSSKNYAQEYIIIILSDFLTGSDFGNKKDLNLIKGFFNDLSYYYDDILSKNNELNSKFHKINYFDFEFSTRFYNKGTEVLLGIVGYKIRPNSGKEKPDETWLFLDSDVTIDQEDYLSEQFRLNQQTLKFSHNSNFSIDAINFSVIDNNGTPFFNTNIGYKQTYDKNRFPIYQFEAQNINLNGIQSYNDFKKKAPISISYSLFGKYKIYDNSSVNFAYTTPFRNVTINKQNFRTKSTIIIMYILIPFLLLLLLIYILFYLGRPKSIFAKVSQLSDSFEKFNTENGFERVITDYLPVTPTDKGFSTNLRVEGNVRFGKLKVFPWKNIKVSTEIVSIGNKPEKLSVFLKKRTDSVKGFYVGERLLISAKKNYFDFLLYFVSNDPDETFSDIEEVNLTILIKTVSKRLFIIKSEKIERTINCHFQIGPELGDVWVGIDPGTTGTCITAANTGNDIIIQKNKNGDEEIMPSILSFNPKRALGGDKFPNFYNGIQARKERYFRYGREADQRQKTDVIFQSVKKLLGYKDLKKITFSDKEIALSGKQLTALLINGCFNELQKYTVANRIDFDSEVQGLDPKRAVVAVPNNFTISKIVDMVTAFDGVQNDKGESRFKEIRYIYEAEAILFNYIANYDKYNNNNKELDEETILIFDMGGATINTTVVRVNTYTDKNNQLNYRTNILGKLGYSIGGDTIDYALIKILAEYSVNYPELNHYFKNAFDKNHVDSYTNRMELKKMILELKKDIIANKDADYLLNPTQLTEAIKRELNISISIYNDDDFLNLIGFKENIKKEIKTLEEKYIGRLFTEERYKKEIKLLKERLASNITLVTHPIFQKYILDNVKSAVKDVLDLAGTKVDAVLFSGRSVFFPMIKETVLKQTNKVKDIHLSFSEAKTAVAKGACWYGVNKSRIQLNNIKTNGIFGFKYSKKGIVGQDEFVQLIDFGQSFKYKKPTPHIRGKSTLKNDFGFDNHHVEFFQIMGKNARAIINDKSMSHKKSKVARIKAETSVEEQQITVYENDAVSCAIRLETGEVKTMKNVISDMEIAKENEEHYTWYVD